MTSRTANKLPSTKTLPCGRLSLVRPMVVQPAVSRGVALRVRALQSGWSLGAGVRAPFLTAMRWGVNSDFIALSCLVPAVSRARVCYALYTCDASGHTCAKE